MVCLSTPCEADSADVLNGLGVPAVKIPSGEITNRPLVARMAGFGRPVILSTGMANLAEVATAVDPAARIRPTSQPRPTRTSLTPTSRLASRRT